MSASFELSVAHRPFEKVHFGENSFTARVDGYLYGSDKAYLRYCRSKARVNLGIELSIPGYIGSKQLSSLSSLFSLSRRCIYRLGLDSQLFL